MYFYVTKAPTGLITASAGTHLYLFVTADKTRLYQHTWKHDSVPLRTRHACLFPQTDPCSVACPDIVHSLHEEDEQR